MPITPKAGSLFHADLQLPTGRCVVVANARKWAWVSATGFDSLVVDEAYQMADVDFIQVARLAGRFVQVGDPGQINPFQEAPIERWRCDPAGPHVPAPEALLARRGEEALARFGLPVSRRLLPDTVAVVQPSFYPTLPFRAMAAPGERHLAFAVAAGDDLDGALDRCADGRASLALVELPPLLTNEDDPALAAALAEAVWRIVARGAAVRDGGRRWAVRPDDIGVVCAHTSQVNAVRERLDPALAAVMVDTANRWQGLERPLMLVHHPLSGRSDASEFHLEAGRLCVMASRHRVACWIFAREGVERTLEDHVPTGDRALGIDHDPEHEGRRAHLTFMRLMRTPGRTAPLTG